jgi:hypothetical protein
MKLSIKVYQSLAKAWVGADNKHKHMGQEHSILKVLKVFNQVNLLLLEH